jgi:hypothetical protein
MREQRGNPYQTPVRLRTNAPRQTEEQVFTRNQSRQPRPPRGADEEIDDGWTGEKPHSSAIRYDRPSRRETTRFPQAPATKVITSRRFTLVRFLVIVGLLLFVLALGIMAFSALSSWWRLHTDDVTFGRPRTYQTDQYVGHGDSPTHPNHFIALNLSGVVEVVELNIQDAQKDRIYFITTTNSALNPVTLSFPTVDGKQYMYINIGDSNNAYTVAMINDGKAFVGAQH